MTFGESLLPEFDQEMASTRAVLERLPDDKWDWKAHPKSNTIGWNANHLAEIPGWLSDVITKDVLDVSPPGGPKYSPPKLPNKSAVLAAFDRHVAAARKDLAGLKDDAVPKNWTLASAGQTILTMPRGAVIRGFVFSHMIHHRAILTVYLRLNDVPVPGIYGPSGDSPA